MLKQVALSAPDPPIRIHSISNYMIKFDPRLHSRSSCKGSVTEYPVNGKDSPYRNCLSSLLMVEHKIITLLIIESLSTLAELVAPCLTPSCNMSSLSSQILRIELEWPVKVQKGNRSWDSNFWKRPYGTRNSCPGSWWHSCALARIACICRRTDIGCFSVILLNTKSLVMMTRTLHTTSSTRDHPLSRKASSPIRSHLAPI